MNDHIFISQDRHFIYVRIPEITGGTGKAIKVPLRNGQRPSVHQTISTGSDGRYDYRFIVSNGHDAMDAIGEWAVLLPARQVAEQTVHSPNVAGFLWVGSVAGGPAVNVNQAALGTKDTGRYLQWFEHEDGSAIKPGGSLAGFEINSPMLPGFTTAWFGSGQLPEYDRAWPDDVFRQLELLEDRMWREVSAAVIGPVVLAGESPEVISDNFLHGIQAWVRAGTLDGQSDFVRQTIQSLRQLRNTSAPSAPMFAPPTSEGERLLAEALQISLHLQPVKR